MPYFKILFFFSLIIHKSLHELEKSLLLKCDTSFACLQA